MRVAYPSPFVGGASFGRDDDTLPGCTVELTNDCLVCTYRPSSPRRVFECTWTLRKSGSTAPRPHSRYASMLCSTRASPFLQC